jgi:hypothetical protein
MIESQASQDNPMARYIQKISLRPYSETEVWAGWELEGSDGEVEGLIRADTMSAEELAKLGVTEFQKIPREYWESEGFTPRK